DVLQRAAATALNRGFEDGTQPLTRDHETAAEGVVAVDQWSVSWKLRLELCQHVREIRLRMHRRCGVVQRFGFLVEAELRARQHRNASTKRFELPREVLAA